eukprot:SAG31_NODE_4312_length_3366_cov_245.528926_2_plen_62_part_00
MTLSRLVRYISRKVPYFSISGHKNEKATALTASQARIAAAPVPNDPSLRSGALQGDRNFLD